MNITSCDCAHNSSGAFRDSTLDVEEAAAVWTMVDVVTARRENVWACLLWASAGWGCLVVGVFSWSVVGRPPPRRVRGPVAREADQL
jgi:hypothetical protein